MSAGITLKEAREILGVPDGATKEQITAAYRKNVAKYHPDANRNKSESERKYAEEMFKQIGLARKVLMNPETADSDTLKTPERFKAEQGNRRTERVSDQSVPGSNYASGKTRHGNTRTNQSYASMHGSNNHGPGRGNIGYASGAADNNKFARKKYNMSTSYIDDVPRVPDPVEEQLHKMERIGAKQRYSLRSDIFRLTPSAFMTLLFLIMLVYMIVSLAGANTDAAGIIHVLSSAQVIGMSSVLLAKIIYDVVGSYYFHYIIKNKTKFGWLFTSGIETIVFSGILTTFLVSIGSDFTLSAVVLVAIGAVSVVTSLVIVLSKRV